MNIRNRFVARLSLISVALLAPAFTEAATPAQNQKFVASLYQDLLNRTPNRNEFALYTFVLSFGATRTQVAGVITSSNEYRTDLIQQYYPDFLNRAATTGEVTFYLCFFQKGATDDDVKAAILGSDEYYRFAGGSDRGFPNKLFEDVLGPPVDRTSAATLEALMQQGTPRQTIAEIILHSLEADQREVTQLFQKFLHRLPQPGELTNFSQMLQLGAKDELVIDLLCGTDEYLQIASA